MRIVIPVSAGDLIDRITILQIKKARIPDAAMLVNVTRELDALVSIREGIPELVTRPIRHKERQLYEQNMVLWNAENRVRIYNAKKDYGKEFVASARRIFRVNGKRARIKREINELSGSELREEKWFAAS